MLVWVYIHIENLHESVWFGQFNKKLSFFSGRLLLPNKNLRKHTHLYQPFLYQPFEVQNWHSIFGFFEIFIGLFMPF